MLIHPRPQSLPIGAEASPEEAMAIAVTAARKGLGWTSPNPPVGCALLTSDHKLLATGYHKGPGHPHAEEEALRAALRPSGGEGGQDSDPAPATETAAGSKARALRGKALREDTERAPYQTLQKKGAAKAAARLRRCANKQAAARLRRCANKQAAARLRRCANKQAAAAAPLTAAAITALQKKLRGGFAYITLEPCAHKRERLSCAKLLSQIPFKAVIAGALDPNPQTSGKGMRILRESGIEAKALSHPPADIYKLIEVFSLNMRSRKAFSALKIASSLDGCISPVDRKTPWITCEKSRELASHIRGFYDAVLIGLDTFLEDNPRLNPRAPPFQGKKNKAIVLDPQGTALPLIPSSSLAKVRDLRDIILVTAQETTQKTPCSTLTIPLKNGMFDLSLMLQRLYRDFQISSVLTEGGAGALSSFIAQNQAHRLYQFIAPSILGAGGAKSWTEELRGKARALCSIERFQIGESVLITGLF